MSGSTWGDLNTSYSFASVKRNLFMTSQGSGDDQVVAMVEWIKSKLSDNAKVARANLATNRLPESMHTGSHASLNCRGALLLNTHQALLNASPADMVASKAEAGLWLQMIPQLHHQVGTANLAMQTGPATCAQLLRLPVSLNTNKQRLMAMGLTQKWEIRLQKQTLLLICGPWHVHQLFTNCLGCKSLPNASLTLFLRTLPTAECAYEVSAVLMDAVAILHDLSLCF